MTKLISHRTTETLPSGTRITTLHLTEEAKRGLSTNGVVPAPELTVHDIRERHNITLVALHIATVLAISLAVLGAPAVVCAMIPSGVVGIPAGIWAWRDLRTLKRRRMLLEAENNEPHDHR